MNDRKPLTDRLAAGPVICAEGFLFELERRGYLTAGEFVPEVALVRPAEAKLRVRAPTVPLIPRLVKVARPDAFVVAVAVPTSVPPPEAMLAVTWIPATFTGLPPPSSSRTLG